MSLQEFLIGYAETKNIHQDEADKFFKALETETTRQGSSDPHALCMKYWSSGLHLRNIEFCTMVCEAIREDQDEALGRVFPIIQGMSPSFPFLSSSFLLLPIRPCFFLLSRALTPPGSSSIDPF